MRAAFVIGCGLLIGSRAVQALDSGAARINFDIGAKRLDLALIDDLSRQANIDITVLAVDRAKKFTSPVVKGQYTLEETFSRMLACTGLKMVQDKKYPRSYSVTAGARLAPRCQPAQPEDSTRNPDTVVVSTGTIISHKPVEDAALTTFSVGDLDMTFGATTTDQLIRRVPQSFPLVNSQTSTAGSINPVAGNNFTRDDAFDLLGLSPSANLVLFNGHRLAFAGFNGSTVSASLLPWIAMDHLEVLVGGASATYGSDAVSGVVNLVPTFGFKGAETTLTYGDVTGGGGAIRGVAQKVGNKWSSNGGFMLAYEHQQSEAVAASQRRTLVHPSGLSEVIPSQDLDTLVGTAMQKFEDGSKISGDAFYSRRAFGQTYLTTPPITTRSEGNASMWDGAFTADIALAPDWSTRIAGAFVQEVDTVTTSAPSNSQTFRTHSTMASVDWILEGSAFSLPGGSVKMSWCGSWRREAFSVSNSAPEPMESGSLRNVWSTCAEVSVPIVGEDNKASWAERIDLRFAWRRDDYRNNESRIANISANNPMVGLLWSPLSDWKVRAIYATAFRPAPLYDTEKSNSLAALLTLPNPRAPGEPYNILYLLGSNPALRPEVAHSYTAGVDFQPSFLPGSSISVTYEHVDYHNRIAAPPNSGDPSSLFSQAVTLAPFINSAPSEADIRTVYEGFSVYDPNNLGASSVRAIFDTRLKNIVSTEVSGVQMEARSKVQSRFGDFDFQVLGQYLIELNNRSAPNSPDLPLLNTDFNAPKLRLLSGVGWTKWGWSVSAHADFTGSYSDTWLTTQGEVASWLVFDGSLAYTTADHGDLGLLDNTTAALSVNNITNKAAPFVAGLVTPTQGYDPANASALGRVVWLIVRKRF